MNEWHPNKGDNLELRTAAYFQAHGYLVRRGVVLSVAAGTADATDIDLLAIRFSVPLKEERLIADCKDRRKSRPFERVLWTLGLASFSHATQSVVVMPRAPWQAREFATQGGVELLGFEEMNKYFTSNVSSYFPFGEADQSLAQKASQNKKQLKETDREIIREDLRLRQMLVIGHPLTNLNRIIRTLSNISTNHGEAFNWYKKYVCFNAAVIASVMLVRFATECKWTPEKDWVDYAKKKLTYGDVPPNKARQLAKLALAQNFFDSFPIPQYADEIIELIRLLIFQSGIAAITPYALDFHLLGQVLGGIPNDYLAPTLGQYQEDSIKTGKRILSALSYAAEMPMALWEKGDVKEVPLKEQVPPKGKTSAVSEDKPLANEQMPEADSKSVS